MFIVPILFAVAKFPKPRTCLTFVVDWYLSDLRSYPIPTIDLSGADPAVMFIVPILFAVAKFP